MHLMILENKRLRSTLRPSESSVSIGSAPTCAVHLPDPRISRHQATIQKSVDGTWWLEIVDAAIPIVLNRAVQKSRARLRHADEIELGQFSIRLFLDTDVDPAEMQRQRIAALSKQHGESLPLSAIIHRFDQPVTLSKESLEQLTLLGLKLSQLDTVRELLPPILRAVLRLAGGRRAWIGIRTKPRAAFDWTLSVNDEAKPCDRPAYSQVMEARCVNHSHYICCPDAPIPDARSSIAVPLDGESGNLGMIYVENDATDPPYDQVTLSIISAVSCCVARPVENVLLKTAAKRQAVAGTELIISRATQDAITPRALPQWDDIQLAAYRCMGTARCCDYYDILQLPDKTASLTLARSNADGIAAPRVLAEVHAACRAALLHADAPHLLCRGLNWILFSGDGHLFVDILNLWVNPMTGKVTACAAGEGVVLRCISAAGATSKPIPSPQPSIGKSRVVQYEPVTFDLAPGDTLVLATAGINAARNRESSACGLNRLLECVADGVGDIPANLLREFQDDFIEFTTDGTCPEDVTALIARWK